MIRDEYYSSQVKILYASESPSRLVPMDLPYCMQGECETAMRYLSVLYGVLHNKLIREGCKPNVVGNFTIRNSNNETGCHRSVSNDRMLSSTKVLIAEEHYLMAQGLQKLLESEFEDVKVVENGRDLFSTVASFKPGVILLDGGLTLSNGIGPAQYFHKLATVSKVIVLSASAEPGRVVEALRCGVSGYLLKRCTFSELARAIQQVIEGKTYVTQLVSQRAMAAAADRVPATEAASLTPRQREVLQLVAEGCTAKEIASRLGLSVKTAVFHKMAIMDKLGMRTTAELTRYAIENGIVLTRSRPHIESTGEALGVLAAAVAS